MSILIKGMEMPTDEARAFTIVFSNGKAAISVEPFEWHEVIPVPDHGDLIDRAALLVEINKICDRRDAGIISDLTCLQQILSALRHAPTIIPADRKVRKGEQKR